jgi:hypothetical protein
MAMILWGFRTYIRLLEVVTYTCGRCGYASAHRVTERVRKFTLFFIPLFPLSTSRVGTCTYCAQATLIPNIATPLQPAQQRAVRPVAV